MGGNQSTATERNIRADFEHQLSSIRNELRNEVETIKQQLSTCQNTLQRTMDMQLHKTIELENHLHSMNSKVVSSNARLMALQEEVNKLKQQILSRENIQEDIGKKLPRMIELENQVHSSNVELLSSKSSLELSNLDVNALRDQIMFYDKSNQDMKTKWDKLMEVETELSSIEVELVGSKSRLEAIKEEENRLVKEVLTHDCFEQEMEVKLNNVLELEKQLQLVESQTTLDKVCFESLERKEHVLNKELSSCEKFDKDMEMKVQRVLRLEKQISCALSETILAKVNIESLEKQEEVLKEEFIAQEKFQQDVEMNLKKKVIELEKYFYLSSI